MMSGIGSTIVQGMAFGTGSAIAHRSVPRGPSRSFCRPPSPPPRVCPCVPTVLSARLRVRSAVTRRTPPLRLPPPPPWRCVARPDSGCQAPFNPRVCACVFPQAPAPSCYSEMQAFNKCLTEVRPPTVLPIPCTALMCVCVCVCVCVQYGGDLSSCQWHFDTLKSCQTERL